MRFVGLCLLISLLCACGTDEPTEVGPLDQMSWYGGIAQLLIEECGACHQAGEIAPFPIEYEVIKARGANVVDAVVTRRMPPMTANNDGSCNTYKRARWLTDEQIQQISDWVDAGAPLGTPRDLPEAPTTEGLERIDGTMTTPEYEVTGEISDEYRCFVLDAPYDEDGYLTGFEVIPGDASIAHHLNLFLVAENDREEVERLDAEDPKPGYRCYGAVVNGGFSLGSLTQGIGIEDIDEILRSVSLPRLSWAPGTGAVSVPPGSGLSMPKGAKFVAQVHYSSETGGGVDPGIDIHMKLDKSVAKPGLILPLPDFNVDLPPGQENVLSGGFSLELPIQVSIYAYAPHMHRLGRTMRVDHIDSDGNETCIAETSQWDFNWQEPWWFSEPQTFGPNGNYRIQCGYNTMGENETVEWGVGTADEMCIGFFYVTSPFLIGL